MANPALSTPSRRSQSLPGVFSRYRNEIGSALRESLSRGDLFVYQMLRYALGWLDVDGNAVSDAGGKALRPTICLLACEATGGRVEDALPAAASLELIHTFSLIHDDIQDRDRTRHHRPTLWAEWGEPKALVAGNTLRVVADMSLWRLMQPDAGADRAIRVADLLTEAYLTMIEGQYLDISYEGSPGIGMAEYLDMISRKTGALIGCALTLGAIIGTDDEDVIDAFRDCGRSLGLVFQIRDDVLGIWGDEGTTGKPVGADIRRKKNTLPVVYAMSRASGSDKDLLASIYQGDDIGDDEVTAVLGVLETVGAREYAHRLAAEHCDMALESLATAELSPQALEDMGELARFLLVREH